MAFPCGCEVRPGAPVPIETLRKHYEHTLQVLLFWELIIRQGSVNQVRKLELSKARLDIMNAIEELYPEVKED